MAFRRGGVIHTVRTPEIREAFLAELANTGSVSEACNRVGIGRKTAYEWKGDDEDFRVAWEKAYDLGTESLEDEAVRRARRGVDEPVFYKGNVCGHITRYSDNLLMFTLKGRRPEKFRDNSNVTLNGTLSLEAVLGKAIEVSKADPPLIQHIPDVDSTG